MPLRRLTRFSRHRAGEGAGRAASAPSRSSTRSSATTQLLRKVVSDELAEVAKTYGTPRRTVLLESAGVTVAAAAAPLEVADDPCFVYLSSTGLLARTDRRRAARPPAAAAPTTTSSSRRSATTARGEIGALTSRGRLVTPRRPRPAGAARHRPTTRTCRAALPFDRVAARSSAGERALALCRAARPTAPASRSAPARAW